MKTTIISICSFILLLALFNFLTNSNKEKQIERQLAAAQKKHQEKKKTPSQTNANKDKLTPIPSNTEAAHTFLGFYLLHTIAIPNFCEKQGVNLDNYKRSMQQANKALYYAAKMSLYFDDTSVRNVFSKNRITFKKSVAITMQQSAEANQQSLKQECKLYNVNAEFLTRHYSFKKYSPTAFSVLDERIIRR